MKSEKQIKRMKLSKVTIARLNQDEEAKVEGGAWPTYFCSNSCDLTLCYECYRKSLPTACA